MARVSQRNGENYTGPDQSSKPFFLFLFFLLPAIIRTPIFIPCSRPLLISDV